MRRPWFSATVSGTTRKTSCSRCAIWSVKAPPPDTPLRATEFIATNLRWMCVRRPISCSRAAAIPARCGWRGQPADRHKPNNVVLGYSRDGWNWSRPDRRPFRPVSDKQGDWNANNVQSAGGGFLVVGDELYFYVSGRSGVPGSNKAGILTTGLATLRRDGFAS